MFWFFNIFEIVAELYRLLQSRVNVRRTEKLGAVVFVSFFEKEEIYTPATDLYLLEIEII